MNDVIKYTAVSATTDVEDRYDGDFFPIEGVENDFYDFSGLDTDGDGLDIEYSEAFGDFVKNVGGLFKKGGMKGAFSNRREGLDNRLTEREKGIRGRQDRRTKRSEARARRKNLRQVALVENNTPQVKQNIAKILIANAKTSLQLKESVAKTAKGEANTTQEQQAKTVVEQANKMAATGETDPPIIDLDAMGNVTEVKDSWWKKQGVAAKAIIIGGGIVALGLTVWGITKIAKR